MPASYSLQCHESGIRDCIPSNIQCHESCIRAWIPTFRSATNLAFASASYFPQCHESGIRACIPLNIQCHESCIRAWIPTFCSATNLAFAPASFSPQCHESGIRACLPYLPSVPRIWYSRLSSPKYYPIYATALKTSPGTWHLTNCIDNCYRLAKDYIFDKSQQFFISQWQNSCSFLYVMRFAVTIAACK